MTYNKKTVEDIDVKGKRVLVRCDFNVPMKDGVDSIVTKNRPVCSSPGAAKPRSTHMNAASLPPCFLSSLTKSAERGATSAAAAAAVSTAAAP